MPANIVSFSGPASGQAQSPSAETPAGDTPQGNKQDTSVSLADVQRLIDEGITKAIRTAQSMSDKAEARIRKEVEARVSAVKAAGLEPTPEQITAITAETRKQIGKEEPAEEKPQDKPKTEGASQTQDQNPIQAAAIEMMREYGVELNDEDPEVKTLDNTTPTKWLISVEKALQAKKERIATDTQARVGGTGGRGSPGNPIKDIKDIDVLYRMATKKK